MSVLTLVDTGPLVALCDERDALHDRAVKELDRLRQSSRAVLVPNLTEACFLLPKAWERSRLRALFDRGVVELDLKAPTEKVTRVCFDFLERFAEHGPDFADAWLLAHAAERKPARIWTFDSEFRTIWRLPGGARPGLVPSA